MNNVQAAPIPSQPVVAEELNLARVYVWELPVRVCHWAIVLSIAVLAVTGLYIGRPFLLSPGEARGEFVMGWMTAVHYYAAIVFTLAVLARIAWMFMGNPYSRWDKFVPFRHRRVRGILPTIKYYLFLSRPPGFVGHNPLAGLTYLAVYALCLVQVLTGLALFSVNMDIHSPLRVFAFLLPLFGGAQTARWIHHVIVWLLLGFVVHHVYAAVLVGIAERNATVDSIVSGYKWVNPKDLVYSGYRFLGVPGRKGVEEDLRAAARAEARKHHHEAAQEGESAE